MCILFKIKYACCNWRCNSYSWQLRPENKDRSVLFICAIEVFLRQLPVLLSILKLLQLRQWLTLGKAEAWSKVRSTLMESSGGAADHLIDPCCYAGLAFFHSPFKEKNHMRHRPSTPSPHVMRQRRRNVRHKTHNSFVAGCTVDIGHKAITFKVISLIRPN